MTCQKFQLLNWIKIFPGLAFICWIVSSCHSSPNYSFSIPGLDTTIKATSISIDDLAKNYKQYQGQYIETKGTFFQAFEEFAVYTDKSFWTGERKGFWLETDPNLNIDNKSFESIDGKRVRIKGIIDTTSRGHLGSYLATIREIYFWEQ